MSIRREDKELIHNLAVLGSLLGACLGTFLIVHLSNKAHERDRQITEYQQTHAALAKLSEPKGVPGELVVDPSLLRQMQEQIGAGRPDAADQTKSVWLRMPRWVYWGICGTSGIAGAAAGFAAIWLTGWSGSVFLYYFIRCLYKLIRKLAPNCAAARCVPNPNAPQPGLSASQRDDNRVLPMLIKLLFLLLLVLAVLGIVVYHLAGI